MLSTPQRPAAARSSSQGFHVAEAREHRYITARQFQLRCLYEVLGRPEDPQPITELLQA